MSAESVLAAMTARAEAAWREQRWPPPQGPTHLGPLMAEHIAAARTDVPRLVAGLRAVLALHIPIAIQEADEDGVPYEPGTGHDWPPICHACTDDDLIDTIDFGDLIECGQGVGWPCATVAAITAALEES